MINKNYICFLFLLFNLVFLEEKIIFESANPFTFKHIITDLNNQESQEVYGILTFPDKVIKENKKYPLIIGVAGSNGWGSHHYEYLSMYREMGIATFELKSFSSRDISSTVGTQIDVTMAMMVLDAYRALDTLSKHKNINNNKVAITGWSLGGGVSLFSAWETLVKAINPKNNFSAHLPIYPPCMIRPDNIEFTDAPIHIQIGAIDNWTPADACEYFVSESKKSKDNIDITVYENSHHGFDSEEDIIFIEHAYSFTDCMFDISDDGAILMNYLNIPMTSPFLQKIGLSFCVKRGTNAGGNPLTREKAFDFSKAFMSKHLMD